jgi:hypothetical protein
MLFRTRVVRTFATANKNTPFLTDAIAKAAIGKDANVAASFVSAFAPLVHQQGVRVAQVSQLPETTFLGFRREMKNDIAFRYSVGKETDAGKETAVMEVVPLNRALVEIQQQSEQYLPARSLAHASGHFLAAVNEAANAVKAERQMAKEQGKGADGQQATSRRRSKGPLKEYDNPIYTAYIRVEPVHLLMLSDFCYAYDTSAKQWRSPKSSSVLTDGKYGWASPLFSTFRLTTDAANLGLCAGVEDPGPSSFASSLRDRLSITIIHLPLVPSSLDDKAAWDKVATLPEHQMALKSDELRQWLYYLAHTSLKDGKVEMPLELRTHSIFRKSAEMAEELLSSPAGFTFSEKEMADAMREVREDAATEREAAAAKERAAAAEREAAAAEREAAAAEREAALRAEVERLTRKG